MLLLPSANVALWCVCRGALRGAASPLSMPALLKELGVEGLASLSALVPSLVEELVAQGERWSACVCDVP